MNNHLLHLAEDTGKYHTPLKKVTHQNYVLYHEDSLHVMQRILEKYPNGCFDMIFVDPPYLLSNDGITCKNGEMVSVNKGKWDKSKGIFSDQEFYERWLRLCYALLKPNGTIWVCGTYHNIYSRLFNAAYRLSHTKQYYLGKTQSSPQSLLPIFHTFNGNFALGKEKQKSTAHFPLRSHEISK